MAAPALGAKAWMGWGREITWGSPVTRTKFYEIAGGETLALNQTYFESPALGGAAIKGVYQGTKNVTGAQPCPVQYEGLEELLKDLIGSVSTAASGSFGYKHTFTPADTLPVGLTVELHRDLPTAKSFLHTGCKVTKGVFAIERDKVLMFTPTFLGGNQTLVAKSTPTFPTAPMILQSQLALTKTVFAGTIDVKGATIEVNNPQSEDRFDLATGGTFKEPTRSGKRTVIVNIDAEASEEAQVTDWTAGTTGTLVWTWTGPYYHVSPNESYGLVITLNGIFTARKPQVADAGPVKLPGVFQCYQTAGGTPDIKIELTNQTVSVG